jgi:hypothetical protein
VLLNFPPKNTSFDLVTSALVTVVTISSNFSSVAAVGQEEEDDGGSDEEGIRLKPPPMRKGISSRSMQSVRARLKGLVDGVRRLSGATHTDRGVRVMQRAPKFASSLGRPRQLRTLLDLLWLCLKGMWPMWPYLATQNLVSAIHCLDLMWSWLKAMCPIWPHKMIGVD